MKRVSLPAFAVTLLVVLLLVAGCRRESGLAPEAAGAQTIENKGSDTLVNLALAWAERYQTLHPEISLAVTGGGSGTGIAAIMNGTVDIANASRAISPEEIETARANGIEPVEFVVARDAIAVIVHRSNPLEELTLQQISDIYTGKITNWQGVGGDDRPVVSLSRETNSGTHIYFLEAVVRLGDEDNDALFSPETLLLPSSEGIIAEVRDNPNAIGYDGLGYVTDEVKTLAVGRGEESPFYEPSIETVNAGEYPVSRDLYMYTANEPFGAVLDYLNWVRSPEAQEIVRELGFVPIEE